MSSTIKKKKRKYRFNIEMGETTWNNLYTLHAAMESASVTETIRNAINMAKVLIAQIEQGGTIQIQHKDGTATRVMMVIPKG